MTKTKLTKTEQKTVIALVQKMREDGVASQDVCLPKAGQVTVLKDGKVLLSGIFLERLLFVCPEEAGRLMAAVS